MSKPGGESDGESLPALDFATFLLSLSHNARVHLGDAPDLSGAPTAPEPEMAKQMLDLLSLLREKTAGNLNGHEERLLDQILIDVRARYEEVRRSR
jgi:hypothetical protein